MEEKSWGLFHAGHVKDVIAEREDGQPEIYYRGKVVREMKVKEHFNVTLNVENVSRKVVDARCNCKSGIQGHCKHVGAFVLFVNHERMETKTDRESEWQKPSSSNQDLYPKGKTIDDIIGNPDPTPRRTHKGQLEDETKEILEKLSAFILGQSMLGNALLFQHSDDQEEDDAAKNPSTGAPWVEDLFKSPCPPIANPDNLIVGDKARQLYETKVSLSTSEIITICKTTVSQSRSDIWYRERKIRITASKGHKISGGRMPTTQLKYFNESPNPGLKALAYGREMEPFAVEKFTEKNGLKLERVGLCIKPDQPWLTCSPDGLILEDNGSVSLLKIKCPVSCEGKPIKVDYVMNGQLKKSHAYYGQVQLSMYVLNLTKCYFYIFSEVDTHLLTVSKDDQYI